jgi:hypothetical protein
MDPEPFGMTLLLWESDRMKCVLALFKNNKQKLTNIEMYIAAIAAVVVVVWVCKQGSYLLHIDADAGIEQIDLDTIYLEASGVEVNFAEIILSDHNESRKLIVSKQNGKVTTN